jgi:hypothetical protein
MIMTVVARNWITAIKAGATYFGIVFLFGFMLGAIRVMVVSPHLGQTLGVLLETPVILTISWVTCRWCIDRFRLSTVLSTRLLTGMVAFGLLQCGELGVAVVAFGRTIDNYFEGFRSTPGVIGLLAQVIFALFPLYRPR